MAVIQYIKSHHQGSWNIAKLTLRCTSFVISVVLIGLSADEGVRTAIWVKATPQFYHFATPGWYFCLPIALYSIILDSTELICAFMRKRNPGISSGWHVGAELFLLGGYVVALSFLRFSLADNSDIYFKHIPPKILASLDISLISFTAAFSAVRFVLFVMACIDTHRYNNATQIERILHALRQADIDEKGKTSSSQATENTSYTYHATPVPPQEPLKPPVAKKSPQEPSEEAAFNFEIEANQKFPVELSTELWGQTSTLKFPGRSLQPKRSRASL
ncbi:hypothetical protein F5Y19DRAFT_426431 [Xylariaceae sp. FL1651]|nr:hypothetical protein F5Y19DRAFT_426431 [Xylariaceae sp. FL1651]